MADPGSAGGDARGLHFVPGRGVADNAAPRGRISGVSGHDFVISARYCFGFGADSTVSVFISWHGRGEKTLLFRYDPVTEEDLPVIVSVARHRILIAVRDISSLIFRRDRVNNLIITYDIGHVHFPDTDGADKQ